MAYSYSEGRFAYLAIIVSELSFCIIFTSDLQFFFKLLRLKNNNKKTVEKLSENIKSVRFPQASYPSQIFCLLTFSNTPRAKRFCNTTFCTYVMMLLLLSARTGTTCSYWSHTVTHRLHTSLRYTHYLNIVRHLSRTNILGMRKPYPDMLTKVGFKAQNKIKTHWYQNRIKRGFFCAFRLTNLHFCYR